jgi:hypothetical protein
MLVDYQFPHSDTYLSLHDPTDGLLRRMLVDYQFPHSDTYLSLHDPTDGL